MENITIIAAIGKNRELGKDNKLIWYLPDDLKFFKDNTIGKPVVMGYKTMLSLPKKLKDRKYLVLTSKDIVLEDGEVFHNLEDLINYIKDYKDEVMIIGGASIYKQLLPYTNKMLLTEVDSECIDADAYFPEFNKNEWDSSIISSHITEDNISYKHLVYKRKR